VQIFVNGMISGLTLALLALSFAVVYLPTRVFFIALAGIYTIVPFIAWDRMQSGWTWYSACGAACLVGIVISLLCEVINHQPLSAKEAPSGAHLISSLGIYIILAQCTAIIWGNETKVLRSGVADIVNLRGVILTHEQTTAFAVSLSVLVLFSAWLWLTKIGLEFRALANNAKEFALRGYNVRSVRLTGFAVSGFLCSVSALLTAYDVGFDPHGGLAATLLAVVAVIIGGRPSFLGAALGALFLGLVRSEVSWFFSARWEEAVTFALLAFFLLVRPEGMLGRRMRLEAEG
jgi:branched-chain amino acid transport system permease protein